jgi:hypothetical protein
LINREYLTIFKDIVFTLLYNINSNVGNFNGIANQKKLRLFRTICGWLRACEGMGACGLVDNIPVTHRAHRPSWGSMDNLPVAHRSPALQGV